MEKIGGSISFQLIDIFNILENKNLSEEEKRVKIIEYQSSIADRKTGIVIDDEGTYGQCKKNGLFVFGDIDVMTYEDLVRTKEYVDSNLSSFTCEAEMKMTGLLAGYNKDEHKIEYRFDLADKVYKYAKSHGKAMRGHTLVWHNHEPQVLDEYIQDHYDGDYEFERENNPDIFFNKRKELTKSFLAEYIKAVGERYPDCYCWDVLNEIVPQMEINDPNNKDCPTEDERKDGLRHSKWFEYLGKDYYIEVLKLARENLPEGTKLFYNEFGEQHPEKRADIIQVIENIKRYEREHPECGTLLDGIGLQSHYNLTMTPKQIKQIYKDFGKISKKYGIEIQVTEMDVVPVRDKNGKPFEYDPQDFSKYVTIWNTVFKCANKYGVRAFTGWGISDALSWYPNIDCTMVRKNGEEKDFRKNLTQNKDNTLVSYFSNFINNIINFGKKKDIKMLPEASQDIKEESNSRNTFLESLRVAPEELARNKERQQTENVKIIQDKKDGPRLED